MSKKKSKTTALHDVTINDSANAMKPVKAVRKSTTLPVPESWDELLEVHADIDEPTTSDGTKNIVYKQRKPQDISVEDRPGIEYPEIIWYLISKYIKPEDIGSFARINKSTYYVTRNKSFWLLIYKRHCENRPQLPARLSSDSFKAYGLRQTVVRALFHTYDVFVNRLFRMATQDSSPHSLVNRKCVNVWFCKGVTSWSVYFKFKEMQLYKREPALDFLEELGRIDANPEEDIKVLQVSCKRFQDVPPLMGMTLSSVTMTLAPGFLTHRLTLGFNSTPYTVKGVTPECTVVLDAVVTAMVREWWHPCYPHGELPLPRQEPPLLRRDFFDDDDS